jgi:AcrR family transcriptional regulator
LLEAALTLFVEKGFAATRAEEVALRAGVSKGTLYLYFPSKEELLKAVIVHFLSTQLRQGIGEALAQQDRSGGQGLRPFIELFSRWWLGVLDSPASAVIKLVMTEVRNFPDIAAFYAQEVVEPGRRFLSDFIEEGIRRGDFRPCPVPHAVHSLVFPMLMLCVHKHSIGACHVVQPPLDPEAFITDHICLVLSGLRPQGSQLLAFTSP